jgi:hypothetical protein
MNKKGTEIFPREAGAVEKREWRSGGCYTRLRGSVLPRVRGTHTTARGSGEEGVSMGIWPVSGLGLVAGFAACLLLAGGAAAAFNFKDEAGKFSVQFPAEPSLDKREGQSATGPHVHYTWEVDVGDRHFSVTYTEYTKAPVKNYDKNVMGLLAATKGKLIHQAKIVQHGIDGREIITLLPDRAIIRQRMFQVGNRLYQAVYAGPHGTERQAEVETFMASFTLLK